MLLRRKKDTSVNKHNRDVIMMPEEEGSNASQYLSINMFGNDFLEMLRT